MILRQEKKNGISTDGSSTKTKETDIKIELDLDNPRKPEINTGLPFFDHMPVLNVVPRRILSKNQCYPATSMLIPITWLKIPVLCWAMHSKLQPKKAEPLARFGHFIIPDGWTL